MVLTLISGVQEIALFRETKYVEDRLFAISTHALNACSIIEAPLEKRNTSPMFKLPDDATRILR